MGSEGLDPIALTVIANRLESIAREMGAGMLRSSRSPIFAETKDFVTAVFDHRLRLVGQAAYIPVLMGGIGLALGALSRRFEGDIEEGDVLILNDPYRGNNHLPDITVARPVFLEGRLRFWALARGHHADIGGGGTAGYNPEATNIWQEGLRIPPSRLCRKEVYNRELLDLILLNVRLPRLVEGDLKCQAGACHVGEKALRRLADQYGIDRVEEAIEEMLIRSREQMQARIGEIPDGRYHASRPLDQVLPGAGTARPTVRLELVVSGQRLIFDFSGTDPQIPSYYNSSLANTVSSCSIGVFSSIAADIRVNHGSTLPLEVIAPEGCLLNPREGAPTTQCTVATCAAIVETVWLALSQAVPRSVQAGWARSNSAVGTSVDSRTGHRGAFILKFNKGGGGGAHGFDGWSHIAPVSSMGGARVPDVELHELSFPHRILTYEYQPDSAGSGRWRGGHGTRFSLQFLEAGTTLSVQTGSASPATAPAGLAGGSDAPPGRATLIRPDGESVEFRGAALSQPEKGDVVEFLSSGGGGYGSPHERPPGAVLEDVVAGLLSREKAEQDYGVVLDRRELAVDEEATRVLRKNLLAADPEGAP